MTLFVVTYSYTGTEPQLAALRPERFAFFADLERSGHLRASGQLVDGPLGDGMLVLDARDAEAARDLLTPDPFGREGHIARLDIAAWRPTVGSWLHD